MTAKAQKEVLDSLIACVANDGGYRIWIVMKQIGMTAKSKPIVAFPTREQALVSQKDLADIAGCEVCECGCGSTVGWPEIEIVSLVISD